MKLTRNLWRIWTVAKFTEKTEPNEMLSKLNSDIRFLKFKLSVPLSWLAWYFYEFLHDRGGMLLTKLARAIGLKKN